MRIRSKFETYKEFVKRYSKNKTASPEVVSILQTILADWEVAEISREMNNGK
jgi:hypothetical protein